MKGKGIQQLQGTGLMKSVYSSSISIQFLFRKAATLKKSTVNGPKTSSTSLTITEIKISIPCGGSC